MRRPPRSPLFPYTTLFRSLRRPAQRHGAALVQGVVDADGSAGAGAVDVRAALQCRADRPVLAVAAAGRNRIDRKSTRLNSSHMSISYAVFCLKKKKKISYL